MKLIDLEDTYKVEIELNGHKCNISVIGKLVDAVPVVRCKDCIEFSDDDEEDGWGFCNNTGVCMKRDGFCSCGERKENV